MKEFKALLRFINPYKWILAAATLAMVFLTILNMAGPWMIRNLISTVREGVTEAGDFSEVNYLALAVISIYFFRAVFQFASDYISHYGAWRILENVRRELYDHLQNLSLKYYQDKQTGDLMSRVIHDTRNFEHLLAHAIPTVIVNALMLVGVFFILFSMNVRLTLYTLIPIPFLAWMVLKFSVMSRPLFKNAQREIAEVNSILQDNFSGIKEIKAFTQEGYESSRAKDKIKAHTNAILDALLLTNAFRPGITFVSNLGTVIVIFFGGRLALSGELPLENLVAFLLYLDMFYRPITELGRINEGLQQALASAERVLELFEEEPQIEDSSDAVGLENIEGKIKFDEVSFRYVEDVPVIKNISFEISAGETLALVGPTGVGKTTIARLIPRFYEAVSGEIRIDDHQLEKIKIKNLRSQISIVSQDVFLFNGTVKENILYGRPGAAEEEVIKAAKAANAHDFILELENGYQTKVGERGVKLSGGQKQRISIARAVLKDAPILILDEATSAVDTQTEILIQEALDNLMAEKTTVVIAHRLSTIQDADQIIVLENGEIVEKGTHEQLLKENGLYTSLCRAQNTGGYIAV
ncbi:MAG: ABC transporter ATP-binding protein [Halanaerobium sp.]